MVPQLGGCPDALDTLEAMNPQYPAAEAGFNIVIPD